MKRKMKKSKIIIFCNLLILFTAAYGAFCAEANKPVVPTPKPKTAHLQPSAQPVTVQAQTSVPAATAQPQTQPTSSPPQAPDNAYSYNPLGKPDPFKPFIEVELAAAKKEKETKVESIFPLQRAAVESFKLVGIIGDQARRVAVVEDSAKKFYPIFVGTRIGLHNGKVTDILADRLAVDEPDGKKVKRII